MDIEMDDKDLIPYLIREEVGERRSDLNQVKEVIINEIGKRRSSVQLAADTPEKNQHATVSLSTIDDAYINQKYIGYCLECWLQEVASFLNDSNLRSSVFTGKLNHDILQDLLNSLDTVQDLCQIPKPLNKLEYYRLLMKNQHLIGGNNERTFIRKFKSICSEKIIPYIEFVQTELDFLRAFVDFLLASKSIQGIIDKLQLRSFCNGDLPFGKLIEGILNLEVDVHETEVTVLQEAVDCLKEVEKPFLTKKFKEVIHAYIKPVKTQVKKLDGRLVIETEGKCIVMSNILDELETHILTNSDIEEVRIVGADILHIDANLRNSIWHGKNVIVIAKIMKIYNEVTWDVSGQDSDHTYHDNAGTGKDGHGKQGADGYPGESGGNVLIETDEIMHPENFNIISHGGKGSRGQDGGNGSNGANGKGITNTKFHEQFPSVVVFLFDRLKRGRLFDITVNNIKRSSQIRNDWSVDGDVFIEVTTSQGNEITFSYCSAGPLTCLQSFLLYKGSLGKPGGRGGKYGLGGKGGFNGSIDTHITNIGAYANSGEPGENGNGGWFGKHGKNGWDMGYADYQHWAKAVIYGDDESSKLKLTYHDTTWGSAPDDSIWCPWYQKYGQITAAQIEHRQEKEYQERMHTRENNDYQHQAEPTKKKSILRGKILADYSHCFSSIERSSLQNLQFSLDNGMQRALQAMVENAEQQEKVTAELKVRQVKSARQNRNMRRKKTAAATARFTSRDTTQLDIEGLIHLLTSEAKLDDQFNEIKNKEFNYLQLDTIWSSFEKRKNRSTETDKMRDIEQLLIKKYRFGVLVEIGKQLPRNQHIINNPVVSPERASRYLIVDQKNENTISHNILGTLNQYLYGSGTKQREIIYTFFNRELRKSPDREPVKRAIETFVLKVGKSEQVSPDVEKFYDQYQEFSKKQGQKLDILLEPLTNELKRHKHIFALWIKRNNSQHVRIQLNKEIRKHEFLNALYIRFNNQLQQDYDWDKCCNDEGFLIEYYDHICERGPFSESYRELLAYVFDANIRLYYEGQNKQLYMIYNHNPSGRQAVHVLYRANKLKQLNIDENYLKLEEGRSTIGRIYANILAQTKEFSKKKEFDDYFKEKAFENSYNQSYGNSRDQYVCTSKFSTKELQTTDNEASNRSVREFLLAVGESEKIHPDIKKFYNEFKKYSEKREQSLDIFIEPFYSELKRYKDVYALWTTNETNKSAKSELEKEIKKYDLLNAFYNRFDNQVKQEYDWNKCRENKYFSKEYNKYVRGKGPYSSKSYSEVGHHSKDQDSRLEKDDANRDNSYTYVFTRNDQFEVEEESDYCLITETSYSGSNISDSEYFVSEEKDIAEIVKYFPPGEERLQVKERLEKIKSQYTGQRGILHYLCSRFSSNGRHVSFQELCYLVNSVLTSVVQDRKELNIFCWIVAAYSQANWIDELVLLQLENYFKKPLPNKSKWRHCLSKLTNKDILLSLTLKLDQQNSNSRVSVQCIEDALGLLSNFPYEGGTLEGLDLREWPDALKDKYWTYRLSRLTNWSKPEDLSEASYYLSAMENTFGTPLLKKFMELLSYKDVSPDVLTYILTHFYNETWNLSEEELKILSDCGVNKWVTKMQERFIVDPQERDVTELVKIIQGNANTSNNILDKLPKIEKSLHSIWKGKHVTNEKHGGTIGRLWKWLNSTAYTSDETSNNFPAIESPDTAAGTSTRMVQSLKSNDSNSKTALEKSTAIEGSVESICQKLSGLTETTAGRIAESELRVYGRMFQECLLSHPNKREKEQFIEESRTVMLALIDRAIELKRKFKLRDTQKLTILTLLTNKRNTLAQVSTGEGKSLIVVALSIMKAICKEKVDIITSSSVLAKRDAHGNKDIYSLFDISVSHNCSENIEKRRAAYSSSQVVYGDLSNFQRDYLLDRFYDKNILGDRNFENVFVDEVDSMLLDKGNNMLYLSHDLPGFDKLESLYVYIWQCVNKRARNLQDFSSILDTKAIKEAVLNDLYGLLTIKDMSKLDSQLDEQQAAIIWERLIEAEILDDQGRILRENINDNQLETVLPSRLSAYENRLRYLLKECVEREKFICVPNYLKPFIEQHLEVWIKSALTAAVMQEGHDYVMDVDRTGTSQDLNPHVTIVDRDTGTDQANSQWDEALHQFLQLKHGCKLSLQSLKAVFISNVSYLKLYDNLYGVTGTLGSHRERNLLLEIHQVDFVTIPTARPKQFHEEVPIFCTNKKEWIDKIFAEATDFTKIKKRSVLIICETIDDAETLRRDFMLRNAKNIHTYTRDYIKFDIADGKEDLKPEQIIIATNLSGRGTDIKITEELRSMGGLHVCLTYLPNNSRIEQQAFGRGARSGDKGSGRLIIMGSKGQEYSSSKILDLKRQRDAEELRRISDIKAYYETRIITEENYFKEFQGQYKELSENLTDKSKYNPEVKRILMQSCLDKWAFWLDRNSKCIENPTDEEERTILDNSLKEFTLELNHLKDKDSTIWIEEQPAQMIKLGKHFCQVAEYSNAIELFDKVIELEPYFSEAAHYYKAFALARKINWADRKIEKSTHKQASQELKRELQEAARLFKEHSKVSTHAASTIDEIKLRSQKSIIQIDTYKEQQKSLSKFYDMFSQSIDTIFDQPVTPKSFIEGNITEELSEIVYEDLLNECILTKPKVKSNISKDLCNKISFHYGIPFGDLESCLSVFEGDEIDEKELIQTLKADIMLPSREDFWKLLIEENILNQEVKYVMVDVTELEKVDALLLCSLRNKITKKELEQQTLKCIGPNEIILNPEQADPQLNRIILEKNVFRRVLDNDNEKYKFLKKRGVFVSNKKACLNLSEIASTTLSRYDFITLEDFSKENIARDDAENILAGLVEQRVLRKTNSEDGTYRLVIPSDQIKHIQFPAYPVYRNAVVGLLSLCFVYRIALEGIEKQLEKPKIVIDRRLLCKPHHAIIYELINKSIIKPVKVRTGTEDLRQKLNDIYSRTITKDDLQLMLSRMTVISTGIKTTELCNHLVKKRWLSLHETESDVATTDPLYTCLAEIDSVFDTQYFINNSEERQGLSSYNEDIRKTIKKMFDNRLELAKENTCAHIVRVLEQSRSPLKIMDVPTSTLKPLTEVIGQDGSRHIEEVNTFTLNGLDQLLRIEENKWTLKIFFNTYILVVMGVIQIAVGLVLEACSSVHTFSNSLISEGVSDILFAFQASCSGYFSWTDYIRYKIMSLMLTAVTRTIEFFLPRGANVQRFGARVAGTRLDVGETVAETRSSQQLETACVRGLEMGVQNHIILRTINAAISDLTHGGVDVIVKNYLKMLCDGIGSVVLSGIKQKMEECSIPASLETAYQILGKEKALKFVNDLAQRFLNEKSIAEKYLPVASRTARSVSKRIEDAIKEVSQNGTRRYTSLTDNINAVLALLPAVENSVDVGSIQNITGNLLNNLNNNLTRMSRNNISEENSGQNKTHRTQRAVQNYEPFKNESIDLWKSLLNEKVARIIEEHIVSPILNEGGSCLMEYCEKIIKNGYRSHNGGRNNEHSDELRRQYQESRRSVYNSLQEDDLTEIERYAVNEYHNNLNTLTTKKSNYKLLAVLVRENVPLDVTSLDVCTQIICKISEARGLTIVVECKGGVKRRFSCPVDGVVEHVIQLKLIANRFRLHGSDMSEYNGNNETRNNCLYEAVSGRLNLNMTREKFRTEVANYIEHDTDLQYCMKQGCDSFPTSHPTAGDINTTNKKSGITPEKRQPASRRSSSVERSFSPRRQPVRRFSTSM